MAFDNTTRNRLANLVGEVRDLLTREFDSQLQELYGIYANEGRLLALEKLSHLDDEELRVAKLLRERITHIHGGANATPSATTEAVRRVLREQSFTVLNRFAALRMAEERGIIVESVGGGLNSKGFKTFSEVVYSGLGAAYERYRVYLLCLFDEMAVDLGVLFDRRSPYGLLFPREPVLLELFEVLNATDIKPLWREDETIGWIYQYFNDPTERKKMREESAAPRNSRELAVRNQFFTPRYVVEFLTDNTLGRIWYEMSGGATSLKQKCSYLVRRPTEIFLKPGEKTPEQPRADNLSQEELLKQPVLIPHRPIKDPRTILMLDPACGSMHFGLYAFDLYEVIYSEAWDLEEVGTAVLSRPDEMKSLHEAYPTKEHFLKDVPRLIVEHNVHGIDIDPRCVQMAGLSLWLRAQKAWKDMGVQPKERPAIKRSNIVCAEPMPGEKHLLREFVEREFQPIERGVFLRLLEAIFDKMQLAGEAGALLKIEEEIRSAIEDAKAAWQKLHARPAELFATSELNALSKQPELDPAAVLHPIAADFWETVESRLLDALRHYAEQAENGGDFQRRLFAEDAARGFAFIDICSKRYEVVLMNPPFGDASLPSKPYIEDTYGDTKGDVYKAFVECFHVRLLCAGYLGIISSRTGFFLGQSEDWRTRVVLRLFRPIALADLGMGVLDAMVEVAAYVLRSLSAPEARDLTFSLVPALEKVVRDRQDRFSLPKWQAARGGLKRHQAVAELEHLQAQGFIQRSPGDIVRYSPLWHSVKGVTAPPEPVYPPLVCVRATAEADKARVVYEAVSLSGHPNRFECRPTVFQSLPSAPFAYWLTPGLQNVFEKFPPFASGRREVRQGLATADDFRFLRVWWEVIPTSICPPSAHPPDWNGSYCVPEYRWFPICRGGTRQTFYRDLCAVIDWTRHGEVVRAFSGSVIRNPDFYFRPGFSWPLRGITFSAQAVPAGSLFSVAGKLACADSKAELLPLLALANSEVCNRLISLFAGKVGGVQYEVGLLARIPIPPLEQSETARLSELAHQGWVLRQRIDSVDATSHAFCEPALLAASGSTLAESAATWAARVRTSEEAVAAIQEELDDLAFCLYGLDAEDRRALTSTLATEAAGEDETSEEGDEVETATVDAPSLAADLLAYGLGVAYGRWDIRYATGNQVVPALPDPFVPLPVCPPGQLQNAQDLPMEKAEVQRLKAEGRWDYPIEIPWDGILVDDPNHPLNIERRVRETVEIIWKGRAETIEHEACEILGVRSLREYFRKPAGFFADHLKRHSKSRRQAPIYWPLSTASGSYALWIYYQRLTDQTLFQCVNDFVKPKIGEVEGDLARMQKAETPGRKEREELERLTILRSELVELRDELLRVAGLPYKPNLNDGVLITASPLWKLFRLPKWQKDLKASWESLEAGEYDWAHLAYTIWPDRVKKVCKTDRSIAIAHGLENLCEVKTLARKAKRTRADQSQEDSQLSAPL